jgi:hypothetical protein
MAEERIGSVDWYIMKLETANKEAWELIDKMLPYFQYVHHSGEKDDAAYFHQDMKALLAEIEEKRKPHGS